MSRAAKSSAIAQDKQFASTLAKGLEMLLSFTPEQSLLGNKDFVARTGLDKATVSRLAYTLTQLGYLRHDKALGKYRLGAPVLSMGYPLLASMSLRQVVRPMIRELADEARGLVGMSVRDRSNMVYMEACRSELDDAPPVDIGAAFPIMVSATGHAWLAKAPPPERDKVLNAIKVHYILLAAALATVTAALVPAAAQTPPASLPQLAPGQKPEYLEASFDEMQKR